MNPIAHLPPLGELYDGWKGQPGVEPLRSGGINHSWRVGDHFVKSGSAYHIDYGLDEATKTLSQEARVGHLLHSLGVPTIRYQFHQHHGVPLLSSEWFHGHLPLTQVQRESFGRIKPQQAADLVWAELLHKVGDRHTGNYLVHPDGTLVSIDHGQTNANSLDMNDLHSLMVQRHPRFRVHPVSSALVAKVADRKHQQTADNLGLLSHHFQRLNELVKARPNTPINLGDFA